jgi:ubiquinone/menaquinone biosynthesis C-methylase UbiE
MSSSIEARRSAAHRQFESWSRWYDRSILQWLFFAPTRRRLHAAVGNLPVGARVLDVGCGTGQFLAELLARHPGISVAGLDLSAKMLTVAERRCARFADRAEFHCGDSERLPFKPGSFDLAVCAHSFHHYPNQPLVLAEAARVLKPSGRLLVADADRDGLWGWLLFDGFVNWLEGGVAHCSRQRFRELFSAAGFEIQNQDRHGWLMPFVTNVAVRRAAPAEAELRRAA